MAKTCKPKLSTGDVGTIVEMIEVWEGPMTWDRITDRVALVLRRPFSRQALEAHGRIKTAYQTRKVRLRRVIASVRAGKPDLEEVPPELALVLRRSEALQARVDRLQVTVDAYDAKFVTWLHNARIAGISEDALNAPLPKVDRNADIEPADRRTRR